VRPDFESKGIGVRLFEAAFDILGTERPLLSVSESSQPKFSRLFAHFGFAQEAVYEGRYLPSVQEIAYNGLLDFHPEQGDASVHIWSRCEGAPKEYGLLQPACRKGHSVRQMAAFPTALAMPA
jgi:hypothetical protein